MEAYTILLNSICLIGLGVMIGVLVITVIMNGKINKLNQEISHINHNLSNMGWNNCDDIFQIKETEKSSFYKIKNYSDAANIISYRREIESQIAATKEADSPLPKVKSVGIVFCRNCASQFTSDISACPICGAKRH